MINMDDLGVNFASKGHNERIKHAQMLCKFTPNMSRPETHLRGMTVNSHPQAFSLKV